MKRKAGDRYYTTPALDEYWFACGAKTEYPERMLRAVLSVANKTYSQYRKDRANSLALQRKYGATRRREQAANRMAKRNKVAAVVTLVAVNSAYAAIVSHNYALANR